MLNVTSDGSLGKIMLNDFFLVEVGTQKSQKKMHLSKIAATLYSALYCIGFSDWYDKKSTVMWLYCQPPYLYLRKRS